MAEQGLELMHLVCVELVLELTIVELVQLMSVNHVTHLQVSDIHVLFY